MSPNRNPGRVAGLWYLLLVVMGPLRLIYIPTKLFVKGNATATAQNLVAHEGLFRMGIAVDTLGAVVLVFLGLAFYRLFKDVDRNLAGLVVILGGVMPALLYFVNTAFDAAAIMVAKAPAFLSVFSKPQQDALTLLFLRQHDLLNSAAEMLWGAWLFPLGILTYRSRFLPRFLGVWLVLGGAAYVLMSLMGALAPQYQGRMFDYAQPVLFSELAIMLWLVIRGARPPVVEAPVSASPA